MLLCWTSLVIPLKAANLQKGIFQFALLAGWKLEWICPKLRVGHRQPLDCITQQRSKWPCLCFNWPGIQLTRVYNGQNIVQNIQSTAQGCENDHFFIFKHSKCGRLEEMALWSFFGPLCITIFQKKNPTLRLDARPVPPGCLAAPSLAAFCWHRKLERVYRKFRVGYEWPLDCVPQHGSKSPRIVCPTTRQSDHQIHARLQTTVFVWQLTKETLTKGWSKMSNLQPIGGNVTTI